MSAFGIAREFLDAGAPPRDVDGRDHFDLGEADTLLAFDRNDEQNHVRYGHRWLPEMMALFGETRPTEEFVKATQEKFKEYAQRFGNQTPHGLSPEKRLTGEKIVQLAGAR